jgi:hypothetical protein
MPERTPSETTNLDRYGSEALPWQRPRDLLAAPPPQPWSSIFLSSTRPDGRPHVAAVGVIWHEGDLYFTSGPGTRKSRNLAANPHCVFSAGLTGIDLILEGEATLVDDDALMHAVIAKFRDQGWPAQVEDGRVIAPYSAPSAGPPPWDLYRFRFHTAFGVATAEPFGATRWRFAAT